MATYAQIHYGDDIARAPAFARSVERYGVLVQPPGRVAEYSNLGYGLLGHIVEQRSGRRFGDYLERNVFEPLGMKDAFVDAPASADADVATPYDAQSQALPKLHNDTPGAGNVYASAEDLIRFAQFHLDPGGAKASVLSPESVRRMQQKTDPQALHHYYAGAYYGLGWYVRPDDGGQRLAWHEGGMPGASTIIKLLPERRIGVVVLANKTEVNAITQAAADDALRASAARLCAGCARRDRELCAVRGPGDISWPLARQHHGRRQGLALRGRVRCRRPCDDHVRDQAR